MRQTVFKEFGWAYAASATSFGASLVVLFAFGSGARGEFAHLFAVANVSLALVAFAALEQSAANGRILTRALLLHIAMSCLSSISTILWLRLGATSTIGHILSIGIVLWCVSTAISSTVLGVLKRFSMSIEINLIRVAFGVASIAFIGLASIYSKHASAVFMAYALGNVVSTALAVTMLGRVAARSALIPVAKYSRSTNLVGLGLTGVLTSFWMNIEAILGPNIASFEEIGIYATLKSIFLAVGPIISVIAVRHYGSNKASTRTLIQWPVRHSLVLAGSILILCCLVIAGAEGYRRYYHLPQIASIPSILLLSIGMYFSFLVSWLDEIFKAHGDFASVTVSLLIGCVAAWAISHAVSGLSALGMVLVAAGCCRTLYYAVVVYRTPC